MRVCHVVSSINEEIGGPAVTVPRLAASLASMEVMSSLVTLDLLNTVRT